MQVERMPLHYEIDARHFTILNIGCAISPRDVAIALGDIEAASLDEPPMRGDYDLSFHFSTAGGHRDKRFISPGR